MQTDGQKWVDEKKASAVIGRALPTLRNDRHHGRGVPYYKVGKSVRYKLQDLFDYMEARRITTCN